MNKYGVIMAGGNGTRFWPLSRKKTPKQLLNLSGKGLMVNEAIDRLSYIIDKKDIFIVTNVSQIRAIIKATEGIIRPDHILLEPSSRNTAACIGYAAMKIVKEYGDGVMVITPSDAYIRDISSFITILNEAVKVAESHEKLVTIGVSPTFPATGYGYIRFDREQNTMVKTVSEFKEKPDEEVAKLYFASEDYVWNSGMFAWKASTILKKFEQYTPEIYTSLIKIGQAMNTNIESKIIEDIYPNIRNISIDYAVMEPSARDGDVLVVPGEFGWNDVGSWDMLEALHNVDEKGNIILGDSITVNTTNSVVYSNKRLIATVDIDNLVIIETSDAILVCNKDKTQNVKLIVDILNEKKRKELL